MEWMTASSAFHTDQPNPVYTPSWSNLMASTQKVHISCVLKHGVALSVRIRHFSGKRTSYQYTGDSKCRMLAKDVGSVKGRGETAWHLRTSESSKRMDEQKRQFPFAALIEISFRDI